MRKNAIKVIFAGLLVSFTISGGFILRDKLNHVNVDGKSYYLENLEAELLKYLKSNILIFSDKSFNDYIIFKVNLDEIKNRTLAEQFKDLISGKTYDLVYKYDFDKEGLSKYIDELNEVADMSKDAYIIKDTDGYKLVQEVYGNYIDKDELLNSLSSEAKSIAVENYYVKPFITQEDLLDSFQELDNLSNWFCRYSDGTIIQASADYIDYKDGRITVNTDWISKAIKESLKSYNTVGIERSFITNDGKEISLSSGTWGSSVNTDIEVEILTEAFKNGISLDDRIPEFSQNYEDIGNTYIEVSLENQHVWVYKDGFLVMETDCVTGDLSKGHDTPVGIYFISERISGKYLRGDGYKTWVNKWMRLTNRGHGLHDATWRSSFGGNIYTYDGSHGCINLPKKFAYDLYDVTYRGMPVIIY